MNPTSMNLISMNPPPRFRGDDRPRRVVDYNLPGGLCCPCICFDVSYKSLQFGCCNCNPCFPDPNVYREFENVSRGDISRGK